MLLPGRLMEKIRSVSFGRRKTPLQNNNKKKTGRKAGFIAGAIAVALFAWIFGLKGWPSFVICGLIAFLVGKTVGIMAQGVDTTKKAPAQKPIEKTGDAAVDGLIEKGLEMLKAIREENDKIPDVELSRNIDEIDSTAREIFRTVAEQPSKAPQIRRFMDYYLPTTLKMLSGYSKMNERNVTGQQAQETRRQIESAAAVVVKAFKKQLNNLYQDDILDISTDVEVLETLLKSDGLVDTGLGTMTQGK